MKDEESREALKNEILKHRVIKLRLGDRLKLFCMNRGCPMPISCFRKKYAFRKLYKEGATRIVKMLDIAKIIRDQRTFKVLLKNSLLNGAIRE